MSKKKTFRKNYNKLRIDLKKINLIFSKKINKKKRLLKKSRLSISKELINMRKKTINFHKILLE